MGAAVMTFEELRKLNPPEGPEGNWFPYHNAMVALGLWPKRGLKPFEPGGHKPDFIEIERAYQKLLNKPYPRKLTVLRAFTARRLAEWWSTNRYRKDTPNLPTDKLDDRIVTGELYPNHTHAAWNYASKFKLWMITDLSVPWGVELLTDNEKAQALSTKYGDEEFPPFNQLGYLSLRQVAEAYAQDDWKIPHAAWHTAKEIVLLYDQLAPLARVLKISKAGKKLPTQWSKLLEDGEHWDEELKDEGEQRWQRSQAVDSEIRTVLSQLVAKVAMMHAGGTEVTRKEVEVVRSEAAQAAPGALKRPRRHDDDLVILIALRVHTERGIITDPNVSMTAFIRAYTVLVPDQKGGLTFGQTCWHTEDLDRKNEQLRKLGKRQIHNQFYKSQNALAKEFTSILMGKPRSFDTGELCWLHDWKTSKWTKRKDNRKGLELYAIDDGSAESVLSLHH